jgi:predicted dehydrogenase
MSMAGKGSKRIGFVDHDLENFHANVYLKLLRGELAARGYRVVGCTAAKEKQGRAWARQNGVPYFATAAEMDQAVDCYVILAPSNPEVHLELCRQVFPAGKPTYVDKTFAPDLRTARRIFALADKHRVPMQTTSALRYTNVQREVQARGRGQVRHMVTWGGGSSFAEYAIHPLELAVSCMGPGVERVMRRGQGNHSQLLLDFAGGRTAVVNVYTGADTPFAAAVTTDRKTTYIPVQVERIFLDTAAAVLDLFDRRRPGIDRQESLVIRRILDLASQQRTQRGFARV